MKLLITALLLLNVTISLADNPDYTVASGLFDQDEPNFALKNIPASHQTLYRAKAGGDQFCHHPNMIVFRDRLHIMWSTGRVDEDAAGQRVVTRHSKDGINWSPLQVLADERQAGRKGICVASGFVIGKDELIGLYTMTGGTNFDSRTQLCARVCRDGQQWLPQRKGIARGFFIEAPRRLPNGRLILAGEVVGDERAKRRMRILHTDQRDGLGGWVEAKIPTPTLKDFGYCEPGLFQRGKTLVMSFRNYTGHLYSSTSDDAGKTWTVPRATNFPDSTARFFVGNLPDGQVMLINNSSAKQFDRSKLTIAFSRDGRLFDRMMMLRGEPTRMRFQGKHKLDGWQYPNALVWKDHLFVAYSINKEDVGLSRIALKDLP